MQCCDIVFGMNNILAFLATIPRLPLKFCFVRLRASRVFELTIDSKMNVGPTALEKLSYMDIKTSLDRLDSDSMLINVQKDTSGTWLLATTISSRTGQSLVILDDLAYRQYCFSTFQLVSSALSSMCNTILLPQAVVLFHFDSFRETQKQPYKSALLVPDNPIHHQRDCTGSLVMHIFVLTTLPLSLALSFLLLQDATAAPFTDALSPSVNFILPTYAKRGLAWTGPPIVVHCSGKQYTLCCDEVNPSPAADESKPRSRTGCNTSMIKASNQNSQPL